MNVGIIGCGGMGGVHARMSSNCGLRVVACGDTVSAKAEALAKPYGARVTTDCMGLVQSDDIDVVAVCTPTPAHIRYVIAAAEAGKSIFCEKPFGRTVEECEKAIEVVRKTGAKLFVGHVVRYFHEFEVIRKQIEAGQVGKVGFVKTYRGGIFPIGEAGWFRDYAQSGGVTMDTVIHDFDWIRYAFGDPVHVYCQSLLREDHIDYSLTTLRMKENDVIVHVIGTWAHPAGFRVKVEVCGEKGMIAFDSDEAPITRMMRETGEGRPGMIVPSSAESVSPYQLEWEDFVRWMRGEGEPRVKPEDALWAVRISLGALESAKTKQPVVF